MKALPLFGLPILTLAAVLALALDGGNAGTLRAAPVSGQARLFAPLLLKSDAQATATTLTPAADTYVASHLPDLNCGSCTPLYVGTVDAPPVVGAVHRALFRFDLSGLPQGSTVVSATFQAFLASSSGSPVLDVELKRIDAPWSETTVTWRTQPGYTGSGNVTWLGTGGRYYVWDVTGLVQSWLDGAPNHGLALMGADERISGQYGFTSREGARPPALPTPPGLQITYRP